jgi:hypothetical protein
MRRGASALLLLLAACEPEPPPPPPAPPPPPEVPAPPVPAPADAAFAPWEEVDPETYPALPGAPAAPLRWSFPEGRRIGYLFHQTVRQRTTAAQGERTASMSGRDRNGGSFEIVGRGGRAGVLVTIESREAYRDDRAVPLDDLRAKGPSRFEVELAEDGAAKLKKLDGASDAQLFFDLLLAIAEGERTRDGGIRSTTRVAGRRKVGRRECVRLETEIEAAGPIPSGLRRMRGRAVGYFDPEERRFIRASAVVSASQREVLKDSTGAWATRAVDSHSAFRLELVE